jgi:hypothetical protein
MQVCRFRSERANRVYLEFEFTDLGIRQLLLLIGWPCNTTTEGDELQTELLIKTKRLDTGSPWPISNNPRGKYYASPPGGTIGNGEYPLWQVVRASTAAPACFDPESITIAEKSGYKTTEGGFVDGGASPHFSPGGPDCLKIRFALDTHC